MSKRPSREFLIVYHDSCLDGAASAWAMKRKFEKDEKIALTFIPYGHHDQQNAEKNILAALKPQSEIFFVDVAPRPAFLKELLSSAALAIEIVDHHKSACDNLKDFKAPNLRLEIDAHHPSAAHMVWEKFHGKEKPPVFFEMIAKMDVKNDLRSESEFAAAAYIDSKSLRTTHECFQSCDDLAPMGFKELALEGSGLYRDQYNRIAKLGDNVMYTQIDHPSVAGCWIPILNADVQNFGRTVSSYLQDLGRKAGSDIAFAWYMQGNSVISMSIRSDGSPDASVIARHLCDAFGLEGGGHDTSAAVHFRSIQDFTHRIRLTSRAQIQEARPLPAAKHPGK